MNKTTAILVLVLLLTLAVPLCIARGPEGPRTDDFVDAPYTTIPPEETPTEEPAEAVATEPPGRYGEIHLTDAEIDTLRWQVAAMAYKQKHPYIMQMLYILKYMATNLLKGGRNAP